MIHSFEPPSTLLIALDLQKWFYLEKFKMPHLFADTPMWNTPILTSRHRRSTCPAVSAVRPTTPGLETPMGNWSQLRRTFSTTWVRKENNLWTFAMSNQSADQYTCFMTVREVVNLPVALISRLLDCPSIIFPIWVFDVMFREVSTISPVRSKSFTKLVI